MDCVIYTKPNCEWCVSAKEFMQIQRTHYKEVKIVEEITAEDIRKGEDNLISLNEVLKSFPDAKTVPIILIDGRYIGGYKELVEYFENNGLMLV